MLLGMAGEIAKKHMNKEIIRTGTFIKLLNALLPFQGSHGQDKFTWTMNERP